MAVSVSQAHRDQTKLPDGASTPPTLQPASLSFKDLQSICGKPMVFKEIPVKESRSANVLACYGFPGLRRHKSDDEVGLIPACRLVCQSLLDPPMGQCLSRTRPPSLSSFL